MVVVLSGDDSAEDNAPVPFASAFGMFSHLAHIVAPCLSPVFRGLHRNSRPGPSVLAEHWRSLRASVLRAGYGRSNFGIHHISASWKSVAYCRDFATHRARRLIRDRASGLLSLLQSSGGSRSLSVPHRQQSRLGTGRAATAHGDSRTGD